MANSSHELLKKITEKGLGWIWKVLRDIDTSLHF